MNLRKMKKLALCLKHRTVNKTPDKLSFIYKRRNKFVTEVTDNQCQVDVTTSRIQEALRKPDLLLKEKERNENCIKM